ncbi:septum formation initiator family protein [bacterium]|jgi:cell division protein FtsB|nr:septum formation initiator family protein [bacterium]MBT5734754.1 septum formation initiator family protein [bacterium]MDA9594332.1 septum formation initiator family protein [bacterium]
MRRTFSKRNTKRSQPKSITIFQKQFFQGLVFLIGLSLVIIFVFGDHGLLKLYKIKNERKLIQNKIANLRAERETLKNEKNKIENDLNYIEKIAREKYKMVKPGEKIFKVIDN